MMRAENASRVLSEWERRTVGLKTLLPVLERLGMADEQLPISIDIRTLEPADNPFKYPKRVEMYAADNPFRSRR